MQFSFVKCRKRDVTAERNPSANAKSRISIGHHSSPVHIDLHHELCNDFVSIISDHNLIRWRKSAPGGGDQLNGNDSSLLCLSVSDSHLQLNLQSRETAGYFFHSLICFHSPQKNWFRLFISYTLCGGILNRTRVGSLAIPIDNNWDHRDENRRAFTS